MGLAAVVATWLGILITDVRAQYPIVQSPGVAIPYKTGVLGSIAPTPAPSPHRPLVKLLPPDNLIAVPGLQTSAQVGGAPAKAVSPPLGAFRITLEEAKQRVLGNNKLLQMGNLNAQAKEFVV